MRRLIVCVLLLNKSNSRQLLWLKKCWYICNVCLIAHQSAPYDCFDDALTPPFKSMSFLRYLFTILLTLTMFYGWHYRVSPQVSLYAVEWGWLNLNVLLCGICLMCRPWTRQSWILLRDMSQQPCTMEIVFGLLYPRLSTDGVCAIMLMAPTWYGLARRHLKCTLWLTLFAIQRPCCHSEMVRHRWACPTRRLARVHLRRTHVRPLWDPVQ